MKQKKHSKYSSILSEGDKAYIAFNFGERTSMVIRKEREVFKMIDEVLGGKPEKCKCSNTGLIGVYKGDSSLINISVSTTGSGGNENCQYLMVTENDSVKCYRLTYQLGMYLDDTYNTIKP